MVAWLKRDEGSRRYYSDQFEQVFGMPLDEAWQDWIAWERAFQRENLEPVRKFPITPHRDLVVRGRGLGLARVLRREDAADLRRRSAIRA